MLIDEAIKARHSVRNYKHLPLTEEMIEVLQQNIDECNKQGNLHIQLVLNERKAFTGIMSYGVFSGVENYFVMAGKKSADLDERIGYYGERLVLLAQTLGLNTCWVGLSYRKVSNAFKIEKDEKLACVIALGYGEDKYRKHKIKSREEVSNASELTPEWFNKGIEAALLAPTAVNQQKFFFELLNEKKEGKAVVKASTTFSMIGYTKMDLGIAKYHFEAAAGKDNFVWA
ncbi:MAG: nitroreductase family protein [Bacteroidaceae bacterium]|nr:nitroreductase family protein [Bacteroidaceae bacterium]